MTSEAASNPAAPGSSGQPPRRPASTIAPASAASGNEKAQKPAEKVMVDHQRYRTSSAMNGPAAMPRPMIRPSAGIAGQMVAASKVATAGGASSTPMVARSGSGIGARNNVYKTHKSNKTQPTKPKPNNRTTQPPNNSTAK